MHSLSVIEKTFANFLAIVQRKDIHCCIETTKKYFTFREKSGEVIKEARNFTKNTNVLKVILECQIVVPRFY